MAGNRALQPYNKRASPPSAIKHFLDGELANIERAIPRPTVRSITASDAVSASDDLILADATGGAITVTLGPADRLQFLRVTVKRLNAGANAVTVSGTIDGGASFSLASQYKAVTLQSSGVQWYILSSF